MRRALRIRITGVVQGVGFRPFVYRLATRLGLRGYVVNRGGAEVEVFVEGDDGVLREFLYLLERERPPPARYEELIVSEERPVGHEDFRILRSVYDRDRRSMIPPDIAICDDCVRELRDPGSRFYRYYWNSCAWCGPRFSMIYRTPYDRENTSMKRFPLCSLCEREYRDPGSLRRFHAEGISCPVCGPRTYVYDNRGRRVYVDRDVVSFVAEKILGGAIVAIKGVGGYHIACLASRDDVVLELRRRKKRPYKPFAVMARDLETVEKIVYLDDEARRLLVSPERPILVLPRKRGSIVSEYVAPGLSTLGVMLPYTGLQVLLLDEIPEGVLIMTSGNIHGRPMCTDLSCVVEELGGVVDYIVEHEREIVHRVDDSVIRFTDGEPVFLRRSRGYAPTWIRAPREVGELVAVGAELQVAGAVSFENKIIPTQFIGDLDDPGNLGDLERELLWFIETYGLRPRAVALDRHPLYHSRHVARRLSEVFGAPMIEVQHHHAHIASLMIEEGYRDDETAVGVAIDGTGYGLDGGIWGGEVLLATYESFKRLGSLRPFHLPGGDSAAEYPVKPLIALMASIDMSLEEVLEVLGERGLVETLPYGREEVETTYRLSKRGVGPLTTSLGRTLDAVSALLGVCSLRTYEGEPPMRLEALADQGVYIDGLEIPLRQHQGMLVIDTGEVIEWLLEKTREGLRREDLAATVLYSIGRALGEAVVAGVRGLRISRNEILVSGGAAVNTHIVRGLRSVARVNDLVVKINRRVPPGDGGVAVGQIAVASAVIEKRGL